MKDNNPIITMRVPRHEKDKAKANAKQSNVSLCRYAADAVIVRNRFKPDTFNKMIYDTAKYNKILSD